MGPVHLCWPGGLALYLASLADVLGPLSTHKYPQTLTT